MVRLTAKQRLSIVLHMEETPNVQRTARMVGCSVKAVRRWWERDRATGGVEAKKSPGKRKVLTDDGAEEALKLLTKPGQCNTATRVALQFKVSKATIIRGAKRIAAEAGDELVCRRGRPRKAMTKRTKEKRLEFIRLHRHRKCWDNVMFTDRKRFEFAYPGCKVSQTRWVLKSKTKQDEDDTYQPNHPYSINVYLGLTRFGLTSAHRVAGTSKLVSQYCNKKGQRAKNITCQEYRQVLLSTLLPQGEKIFSEMGISRWWFQQDNDPSHVNAQSIISEFNQQRRGASTKVCLLPGWPPNSPDLNLIENLWSWLQARVNAKGCQSFEEFSKALDEAIVAVPKQSRVKLYNSMTNRLHQMVENGGGPSGY
jgi:transposase/putative hemolysin